MNFFTSCKNPPIFAAIEQEVKLKKFSVSGKIHGLVGIGNMLYVSNGENVLKKEKMDSGRWTQISTPGNGIKSIAGNGTTLFMCSDGDGVYYFGNNFEGPISGSEDIQEVFGTSEVFACKKPNGGNKEYFSVSTSGISPTKAPEPIKVAVIGGGEAVATGTHITFGGKKYEHFWKNNVVSLAGITVNGKTTHFLVGTGDGLRECVIEGSALIQVPLHSSKSFITVGSFEQCNATVGKWAIDSIYIIGDSNNYAIYVAVQERGTRYDGLWGFYSSGQTEWNRE